MVYPDSVEKWIQLDGKQPQHFFNWMAKEPTAKLGTNVTSCFPLSTWVCFAICSLIGGF